MDAAQYLSFTYAEGVVKYKGKIFKSTHDSYIGGHVGSKIHIDDLKLTSTGLL